MVLEDEGMHSKALESELRDDGNRADWIPPKIIFSAKAKNDLDSLSRMQYTVMCGVVYRFSPL